MTSSLFLRMPHAGTCAAILVLGAAGACGPAGRASPSVADDACAQSVEQTIVGGASQETYLGLAPAQIRAIVRVVDSMDPAGSDAPLCTGAFVAPTWVVTAAHCLEISNPAVIVAQPGSPLQLPVVNSFANEEEDVALLQIDTSAAVAGAAGGIEPLAIGGASVAKLSSRDVVEAAGYGLADPNDAGSVGDLHFVVESIETTDPASITVNGYGADGACEGDSGGPMLARAPDGTVVVAGVMSMGSATCIDDDTYDRLDSIGPWIVGTIGQPTSATPDCGDLDEVGRCLYGSALWCVGGSLSAQACGGTEECGWDTRAAGFRCVTPAADPCDGVDSVGACVDDIARWCDAGILEQNPCGCGVCRVDGQTGRPYCGPN